MPRAVTVFSMLYLHALGEVKNLRANVVSSVVNQLADAHDDGALEAVMSAITRNHNAAEQVLPNAWRVSGKPNVAKRSVVCVAGRLGVCRPNTG